MTNKLYVLVNQKLVLHVYCVNIKKCAALYVLHGTNDTRVVMTHHIAVGFEGQ